MNAHANIPSPPTIKDPRIKRELQLAGLRFAIARAQSFIEEAKQLGIAIKDGTLTPDMADEKLEEIGAIDLVYGRGA